MASPLSTRALASLSARRPWRVIAAWVVGVSVVAGVAFGVGGVFTSEVEFTSDEEAQVARELLEVVRGPEPLFEQVIVQSPELTVDDPAFEAFVTELAGEIRALGNDIEYAVTYYELGAEELVSADRHTTLIPTKLEGDIDAASEHVGPLVEVLRGRDGRDGFTVVTGGFGSLTHTFEEIAKSDLETETRVLPVALVILVLVFGAVVAALLPLLLAGLAILLATAAATLLSNAFPLSIFVTNMIVMIGLALGIDYSLLIVERFRDERRRGRDGLDAIAVAGDTAGRAVLFSGMTVVIALMGLLIFPANLFRSLAMGAIFAAIASVMVGLTLLPALLSLLGDRVNRLSVPLVSRRAAADDLSGFWAGAARRVMARPWLSVVLSAGLLIGLATPYFGIALGFPGPSTLPKDTDAYRSFQILNAEFSAGRSLPTEIVVRADDVTAPAVQDALSRLEAAVEADRGIALNPGSTDGPSAGRTISLITVALPGEYASDEALTALDRLREQIVPAAFRDVDADIFVGGQSAGSRDFFDLVDRFTPIVFAFVLGMSFLLLLIVFRSLVVPLKAIVMNLLSVGAAYGTLVLVFQRGVGAGLFGFQESPIIAAWIPLFLFAVLFGLSMDYHVFLLSRIRERYDQTGDNAGSVAYGLRSTANIITGAAAIMVVVFGGFALGDLVEFQQMGFGLAVAVFLDATVVRMVLVPSAMELLGDRNWYLPSWLQWLPDLRVEGAEAEAAAPQPLVAGE